MPVTAKEGESMTLEQRIEAGRKLAKQMPEGYGLTTTDLAELARKHNNNLINGSLDVYPLAFKDGVEWARRQAPRMAIVKTYKDATHGNTATIEQGQTLAYMGADNTAPAFRLTLSADYEGGFVYFVAVYETLEEAVSKLADFGGAEHWHEV